MKGILKVATKNYLIWKCRNIFEKEIFKGIAENFLRWKWEIGYYYFYNNEFLEPYLFFYLYSEGEFYVIAWIIGEVKKEEIIKEIKKLEGKK